MANYSSLLATINANIRANNNQEITGSILNSVLGQMVSSLGAGYQYLGLATPSTSPGTPDQKVFYIAGPGTYTNFGSTTVPDGSIGIFSYDSTWSYEVEEIVDIVDDLTTDDATKALSAKQGKVLQDTKVNTSDIVDNLTTSDATKPLSANQGAVLDSKKVNRYPFITDGGVSLNKYFKELYITGLDENTDYCIRGLSVSNGAATLAIGTASGLVFQVTTVALTDEVQYFTTTNLNIALVGNDLDTISGTIIGGNTDTTIGGINKTYCENLYYSPSIKAYLESLTPVGYPVINVNDFNSTTSYSTRGLARAAVPSSLRKKGGIITYNLNASMWIVEQFVGTDLNNWAIAENDDWRLLSINASIYNLHLILGTDTAYESVTAGRTAFTSLMTTLSNPDMLGAFITYKVDDEWVLEQVLSNNTSTLDSNYSTILRTSDLDTLNNLIEGLGVTSNYAEVTLDSDDFISGTVRSNGAISGSGYTIEVTLAKGDIIRIGSRAYNGFAQFSKVITSGSSYEPLIITSSSSLATETYDYFITEDGDYAISTWSGKSYATLHITKSSALLNIYNDLRDRVATKEDAVTITEITANSDTSSDADFTGNTAISDALDSITDASETNRYIIKCTGNFVADVPSDYTYSPIGQSSFIWTKDYVDLDGISVDNCNIRCILPDTVTECQADTSDFQASDYGLYQPIWIRSRSSISNMTISCRNIRYAVHVEGGSQGVMADFDNSISYCNITHEGKFGDAVGTTGGTALGVGINSGQTLEVSDCLLRSAVGGATVHDNVAFSKKADVLFERCNIQATDYSIINGLIAYSGGNGNPIGFNFRVIDCTFSPYAFCQITSNAAYNRVFGFMPDIFVNSDPMPIYPDSNVLALRITSNTEEGSSVRFDTTSSAFETIIGVADETVYKEINRFGFSEQYGYMWRDGGVGLNAVAIGTLNLYANGTLNLGVRLGDCSGTAKTLGVIVDGTQVDITLNQDFTSMSNDDVLAVINSGLSEYAVADLYKVARNYYPSFNGVSSVKVADTTAILAGMGVIFTTDGAVRRAKNTDGYISGIALDSGANGQFIRIITSGAITYKGLRFSIYQTENKAISAVTPGMEMGISSANDGEFTSDSSLYSTPVLRSKYGGYPLYII